MAKFTASVPLNIKWNGHDFVGQAGTTHRLTDALVDEFTNEVVPGIPGFAWVTQDELSSVITLPIAQTDVSGLTAALAAKYDKTGGTISGAATVTGTLGVGGAATLSSTLIVTGAATVGGTAVLQDNTTVAGTLTAQGSEIVNNALTVGGTSTLKGAVVMAAATATSTLVVQGAATVSGKFTVGQANVIITGGTAFPGSPTSNDTFYRTDLDMWFFYDGTRWLSSQVFTLNHATNDGAAVSATTTEFALPVPLPALPAGSDLWLEKATAQIFITGGSALSGSHNWTGTIRKRDSANTATTITTHSITTGSTDVWRTFTNTIGALLQNGTTYFVMDVTWTKVGSPGNLNATSILTYRLVAT